MQKNCKFALFVFLVTLAFSGSAQKNLFHFGDISRSDLEMIVYQPDPDANAVILSDRGAATLHYISNKFQIEFERNVRIKILNTDGFDYANIEIPYLSEDRLTNVRACTYNIFSDSIVGTPVNPKEFIKDKSSKYHKTLRIAFANVAVGSVIEYQYKHTTEYVYRFIPWEFQAEIPTQLSEFTAEYNDFFIYNTLIKGDATSITKHTTKKDAYVGEYRTGAQILRWVGNNIPAFEREPYITGIKDHFIKVDFELAGTNFPGNSYQVLTPNYKDLPEKVLKRKDFGEALRNTGFLDKISKKIISNSSDDELSKLKAIREFVANKILWDGTYRFSTSENLKKVYTQERGNSAEINLILIAMLRKANLKADPVILSTRSNGSLHPSLAMIQNFNHVVASVKVGDKTYLVDASEPLLPYNMLPFQALNNKGRLINEANSIWVNLWNGEMKMTSINADVEIDSLGVVLGKINKSYSGFDGYRIRRFVKLESEKGYRDWLMSNYPSWSISGLSLQNLDSLTASVNEQFEFSTANLAEPTSIGLIVNPNFHLTNFSNLFVNEKRNYPIDFGCPEMLTYTATIKIPEGFEVDEMPRSISIMLPDQGGEFLFDCQKAGNTITIQSRLSIKQVRFEAKEYNKLRDFYTQAIRKQSELIVLKKI
ncbi:MAG: DUF3857 domain-containing protein [Tenuifilaceae bacterium]|jgi:hypothetical protein|nr:DUF3857 domain-containing protein [Tenuifilaceae bacterium]